MISRIYILCYFVLIFLIISQSSANNNIFCTYLNRDWSKDQQFLVKKVDPLLCTHIIYSKVEIDKDTSIATDKSGLEDDFTELIKLKTLNLNLKTVIEFEGSDNLKVFFKAIINEALRKSLIKNMVDFTVINGFDGIYLKFSFLLNIQFLKEIRTATSDKGLILMSEIQPYDSTPVLTNVDASRFLDFLCISIETVTQNTDNAQKTSARLKYTVVQNTIFNAILNGYPAEKMVFVIKDFRFEEYQLLYPTFSYFGAPTNGLPILYMYTNLCGRLLEGYNHVWDEHQYIKYAYKMNQWISYENNDSLLYRIKFITYMNLAGIMVNLYEDDFDNVCKEGKYPMIKQIKAIMEKISNMNRFIHVNSIGRSKLKNINVNIKKLTNTTAAVWDAKNICKSAGYVNDPNDCDKFHYCVKKEDGSYKHHVFNCPDGLVFEEKLLVCNYLYIFGREDSL